MAYRVGDPIYNSKGMPATIIEAPRHSGSLKVDQDTEKVKQDHRHGYTQGLAKNERKTFSDIMDSVRETKDPAGKIELLRKHYKELAEHPERANRNVARYLHAEIAHIMNTYGFQPRIYEISKQDVK